VSQRCGGRHWNRVREGIEHGDHASGGGRVERGNASSPRQRAHAKIICELVIGMMECFKCEPLIGSFENQSIHFYHVATFIDKMISANLKQTPSVRNHDGTYGSKAFM